MIKFFTIMVLSFYSIASLGVEFKYIFCTPDVDAPSYASGQYELLIKRSGNRFYGIREMTTWYGKSYYSEVFELESYGNYYLENVEYEVKIDFTVTGNYSIELNDMSGRFCEPAETFSEISMFIGEDDLEAFQRIENY